MRPAQLRRVIGIAMVVLGFSALCAIATASPAAAGSSPIGALDLATVVPDGAPAGNQAAAPGLRVAGWAIDPDGASSTTVHLYLNGTVIGIGDASLTRSDVASVYPSFGAHHGFDVMLAPDGFPFWRLMPGDNIVCAYGIDSGSDANALLGCQTVVAGRSPFGAVDVVTALPDGGLRVAGWVIDPDTVVATGVHIWVDGVYRSVRHAAERRVDVGAIHPTYGDGHGFDAHVTDLGNGPHTVCVYGLDTGLDAGSVIYAPHALLACRAVTISGNPIDVRDVPPIGALDLVTALPGGPAGVAGWAIDPDTAMSISVTVRVDAVLTAGRLADVTRTDVGAAYPLYGPYHGYDIAFFLSAGSHSVCTYGIDTASNVETLLGCRDVTV